jgi:hypothetical protein
MSENGNVNVPFTRGDVERLKAIELSSSSTTEALKALVIAVRQYEEAHSKLRSELLQMSNSGVLEAEKFRLFVGVTQGYEDAHLVLHEKLTIIIADLVQFVKGSRLARRIVVGILSGGVGLWLLQLIASTLGWVK